MLSYQRSPPISFELSGLDLIYGESRPFGGGFGVDDAAHFAIVIFYNDCLYYQPN